MTKEEAWREWAAKHRPQNEEAFWICFTDAWRVCEDEHKQTIELLKAGGQLGAWWLHTKRGL
jgi:hypothetical protein